MRTVLLSTVLLGATLGRLWAQCGETENAERPSSPGSRLPQEEIQRRRAALETWAYEPVVISTPAFEFRLDRRDGSFCLKDARTGVGWYSSWGRRGFASVSIAGEAGDRWLPVDRVEDLRADDRSVRLRCSSSLGEGLKIRFEIRALDPPSAGLRISFEPARPEGARAPEIRAVRLLERALWVSDADEGWVAVPDGLGKRLAPEPSAPDDGARRREWLLGDREAGFYLKFVGFMRGGATAFLRWTDPEAVARIERLELSDGRFPGKFGLFTTLEFSRATGSAEFWALGREWSPVVDCARAYASVSRPGPSPFPSLRQKTASPRDLRSFLGAAIFRPSVRDASEADALARAAERIRRELEIDQAAFIVSDWWEERGDRLELTARGGSEGEAGLRRLREKIESLGYSFGMEVPSWCPSFAEEGETEVVLFAPDNPQRSVAASKALGDLARRFRPDLILVGKPPPGSACGLEDSKARASLGAALRETFGLAAFQAPTEADFENASYLGGLLDFGASRPSAPEFWPVLTAAFGHTARFGSSRPLSAGDSEAVLAHLLLGEVPVYELPGRERDSSSCFARSDGWAAGRDLGPQDIFIKNTYVVLSHVARLRVREQLLYHRNLDSSGLVRETYFGPDLRIVVNFGSADYEDPEDGFVIPQYGFVVRHPFLYAFHALRTRENAYDRPAFYCVLSLEGKMYLRAERVLIYRGFGPEEITVGGKTFRVEREAVVKIW